MTVLKNKLNQYPNEMVGTIVFKVGGSGNYTPGESITTVGGFSAKVLKWTSATRTLKVIKIDGPIAEDDSVVGGSSSAAWAVAAITAGTVGGIGVNTGGFNLRVTDSGITRSKVAGSRTLVEVEYASKGMATRRTDFGSGVTGTSGVPTFSLTAYTSASPYDVSAGDSVKFTITSSEAVQINGATFAVTVGGVGRTATYLSSAGNVHTFAYPVVTGDIGTDLTIAVAAGNFTGGTIYDINGQSINKITGTIAVSGTIADQTGVTIQA